MWDMVWWMTCYLVNEASLYKVFAICQLQREIKAACSVAANEAISNNKKIEPEGESALIDVPSSQSATEGERASKVLSNQHSEVGRDLPRPRPGGGGSEKEQRWRSEAFPGSRAPGPGGPPARGRALVRGRVRNLSTQDEYFRDLRCFYIQLRILNSGLGKNVCVVFSVGRPGSLIQLLPLVKCGCLSTHTSTVWNGETACLPFLNATSAERSLGCSCRVESRRNQLA